MPLNPAPPQPRTLAAGGADVADVVVHRHLLDELPAVLGVAATDRPARDGAVEEEAGVGVPLVVELRVQGTEAKLDLRLHAALELQDGNAKLILVGAAGSDLFLFLETAPVHQRNVSICSFLLPRAYWPSSNDNESPVG